MKDWMVYGGLLAKNTVIFLQTVEISSKSPTTVGQNGVWR